MKHDYGNAQKIGLTDEFYGVATQYRFHGDNDILESVNYMESY